MNREFFFEKSDFRRLSEEGTTLVDELRKKQGSMTKVAEAIQTKSCQWCRTGVIGRRAEREVGFNDEGGRDEEIKSCPWGKTVVPVDG